VPRPVPWPHEREARAPERRTPYNGVREFIFSSSRGIQKIRTTDEYLVSFLFCGEEDDRQYFADFTDRFYRIRRAFWAEKEVLRSCGLKPSAGRSDYVIVERTSPSPYCAQMTYLGFVEDRYFKIKNLDDAAIERLQHEHLRDFVSR
jgi:hypothetical protein